MVVIVPVDGDVGEGEQVGGKQRQGRKHSPKGGLGRDLELEHHDREDDSDDAVGQSIEAGRSHAFPPGVRSARSLATAFGLLSTVCPCPLFDQLMEPSPLGHTVLTALKLFGPNVMRSNQKDDCRVSLAASERTANLVK